MSCDPGVSSIRALALLGLSLVLGGLAFACGDDDGQRDDTSAPDAADVGDVGDSGPFEDTAGIDTAADSDSWADLQTDTGVEDSGGDTGGDGVDITFLFTTNEHAAVAPTEQSGRMVGGAANMHARWVADEGLGSGNTIVLSGGDALSRSTLASLTQGEAAVAVMNAMGYTASTIGNLDFNYGREALEARIAESSYAWVAANLLDTASGEVSSLASAYAMVEFDGVKVAIVGLASTESPVNGLVQAMQGLTFADYAPTLEGVVPAARAAGADVVVVIAHVCLPTLVTRLENATVHPDAYFAESCGAALVPGAFIGDVPVLAVDTDWKQYARLRFHVSAGTVTPFDAGFIDVSYATTGTNPVTPTAAVQDVVDTWLASIESIVSEVIGHTATGVPRQSWEMYNFVADTWLQSFPDADFAVQNRGGVQSALGVGELTVGDVISVLPFDNFIFKVSITGAELAGVLATAYAGCSSLPLCPGPVGGFHFVFDGGTMTLYHPDGTLVDTSATYTVLTNNFMYFGGAGFDFQTLDPNPIDTGVNYREPMLDAIRALGTSSSDPLEAHLDATARNVAPTP